MSQLKIAASVALVATAATALACSDRAEPTRAAMTGTHLHVAARRDAAPADLGPKLAELRRATAHYRDFEAAQTAGYAVKVTGCMESPSGGMGYHYAKGDLIDGQVIEARPEVLLYEPKGKGRLQLVGVEFIIPFSAWTASTPPTLYGQTFSRNLTFEVWALHVWAWRENTDGVFADWNPAVTCARDDA
jgi:hypothetical protein